MKTLHLNHISEIPENFTGIVEYDNGERHWYKEGKLHREGGPAREYSNGTKHWYKEGLFYRIDGPAIEYNNGNKEWWIDNEYYLPGKFQSLTRNSIYLGKEKGRYNLEWLLFLTDQGIKEFPIIPGMDFVKEYLDAVQ